MKMLFCRLSIILPISLISTVLIEIVTLTIQEIGLYLNYGTFRWLFIIFSVAWLSCSPLRKSCCDGRCTEVLFNLVPIEVLYMLLFAQWHFKAFIAVLILILVVEIAFAISLGNDMAKCNTSRQRRKWRRLNYTMMGRFTVIIMAAFTAIPCTIVLVSHGLCSPSYQADREISSSMLSDENGRVEGENIYEKNCKVLLCFREELWGGYSIQEKTTFMQALADMEAELLGIPSVPLTAEKLEAFTLGAYLSKTNEIRIDIEHLAKSSAEECIDTVCHEIAHSWQHFLVDNIDWEADISKNPYFNQIRTWKENQDHYIQPTGVAFDSYESQPVEASAQVYAEEETARILSYIYPNNGDSEDVR